MKLALGTAQFAMQYGVTHPQNIMDDAEIDAILRAAKAAGIDLIDTAAAYGDCEAKLGQRDMSGLQIVTKITAIEQIEPSLHKLGCTCIAGMMVHHAGLLLEPNGEYVWEALQSAKASKRIKKIGVSVYDAAEIDQLVKRYDIDIIQLPLNLFDQRLLLSGHLRGLYEAGIEIHARSLFLQGILLAPFSSLPSYFQPYERFFKRYETFLREHQLSALQAALGFINALPEVSFGVVGVNSAAQLHEIASTVHTLPTKPYDFESLSVNLPAFINPSQWPR